MDRRSRHYIPSSEGLEGRQLLSTAPAVATTVKVLGTAVNVASTVANVVTSTPTSNSTSPTGSIVSAAPGQQVDGSTLAQETIEAKLHRINNLPYFVGVLNKDHFVPQPVVENIQNDLLAEVAQLHQADSSLISSFNLDLRKAQSYENITPISNALLNRDLGAALVSAGGRPETIANLQKQLNLLVDYDSTQSNSTIVATYDYATILQESIDTGRPLVPPNIPSLLGADHNGNSGKIAITYNHQPSLTGNYEYGTNIQIVDNKDQVVLGQGAVNKTTNTFTVQFNNKLPDGIYNVRIRAEDDGFVSDPSPKYTFEVTTPPLKK